MNLSHLYVCSRRGLWCSGQTFAHIDLTCMLTINEMRKRDDEDEKQTEEGVEPTTCGQVVWVAVAQVPFANLKKTISGNEKRESSQEMKKGKFSDQMS